MMQEEPYIDKPGQPREAEMPDRARLLAYLSGKLDGANEPLQILQFPGGYSNLTFLLRAGEREYVLRRPPFGAAIRTAHDMGREYRVLSLLKPVFRKVPEPLLYCDDESIIGAPFYIMKRVKGVILRDRVPDGISLTPSTLRQISEAAVDGLAALHTIDLKYSGLEQMGKPEGYIQRQVDGWSKRYVNARTDKIPAMEQTAAWLAANIPADDSPAFVHNDYKYDNLVLDPGDLSNILAVLDWEMATVGSPLMDLGTTLAYWAETSDSPALKPFGLTWMEGNLNRQQVLERYSAQRKMDLTDLVFHYVFGSFKIAVIVQQIYARYKKGFSADQRFASLIHVVHACAANASNAIKFGRISNFY